MEPKKPAEKPVDRFAALTKRLLTVPKKELREDDKQTEQDEPKSRHQKRKEQRRANYVAQHTQGSNTNRNPPSQWG
jgi:hypothetical protein